MLKRFRNDILKYYKYIIYSTKAELKSEVADSYLNWLWWIIEPVCFMFIYMFVFGYVFKSKQLYFPAFIFLGITIWDFFSRNITNSVKMVKNNKSTVIKIYVPKFIFIFSKIGVNFFKMLISFIITIGLMIVLRVPLTFNVLYAIPLLIELILIVFGLTCILLHFGVYVSDLSNVVKIGLRMMFYVTGVFYSIQEKIGSAHQLIANLLDLCNPIAFILSSFRDCLLYSSGINWTVYFIWLIIGLALSYLGVNLIYKNENSYVKVI